MSVRSWLNNIADKLVPKILFADYVQHNGHHLVNTDPVMKMCVMKSARYSFGVNTMALCIAITAAAVMSGALKSTTGP